MRHTLLLLPLLVACAKGETPQTQGETAMPPVALTDADVAGTWTGTSMPEGSDSAVVEFTQICGDGMCKGIVAGVDDTIMSMYSLTADSAMGTSDAFMFPLVGADVVDSWTVHLQNGKAVGTGMMHLADNPDSVVFRYHFQASHME
jgi:hypothetical protein